MSGSNRRNWSSVRAWPEPKSPTSARSAGVHRAVSKRKPPATPPDRQDQPVKPAPSPLCKRALSLTMIPSKSAVDFDAAFAQIKRERPDALVVSSIPFFAEYGKEIAAFAIDQRLPSFTFSVAMAMDGLLLALSPDLVGMYRPAAAIVDKILK